MDLDGDGRDDVISGSWPGQIFFFRRLEDGSFAAAEKLANEDGEPIRVGSASVAFAADWNGNGKLDLLIGEIRGKVYFLPRVGEPGELRFGEPVQLVADGKEISVPGGDAGPVVADWDGDGLPDLLVGCGDGSVAFFRNTGTREEPVLAEARQLVPPGSTRGEDAEPLRGSRAKICVVDYNQNGRLDLLVGDFSISQSTNPNLTDEDRKRYAQLQDQWQQLIVEYGKLARRSTLDDAEENLDDESSKKLKELSDRMVELREEMVPLMPTRHDYHGWVWFYARQEAKPAAGE